MSSPDLVQTKGLGHVSSVVSQVDRIERELGTSKSPELPGGFSSLLERLGGRFAGTVEGWP
ncbi:MAG: hypothetical protein QM673_08465 [Gordonia sp. (in: high G+C Gram-positive bacteria)]